MQRFFINTSLLGTKQITLDDQDIFHQIIKVLRGNIGMKVIFFDGVSNIDFVYEIIQINKKNILCVLCEKIQKGKEDISLNLYQAIPNKIDKIEEILEKGTQIGFSSFYFYFSQRSQKITLGENKIKRFQKIIKESLELSGRNIFPEIFFGDELELEKISGKNLFFHTQDEGSTFLSKIDFSLGEKINIFVGPEGGYSPDEIQNFNKNNFLQVSLGNNILRTQTAGVCVGFYIIQKLLG